MTADTDREARLEEIRERLDAATSGPWEWQASPPKVVAKRGVVLDGFGRGEGGLLARMSDASLVAHAPEDIDWLLSEIDRLREASAILLDVLEDMKPSGADVPAELDYATDDLRRALEGEDG